MTAILSLLNKKHLGFLAGLFISAQLFGCSTTKSPPPQSNSPASQSTRGTANESDSTNFKKVLPPQAMSVGEIVSLNPKNTDCSNQQGWEALMKNQIQIRRLEGINPEELSPEDREFNAAAHQIIWALRIRCMGAYRAK